MGRRNISVVIPVFNAERTLTRAVRSALAQEGGLVAEVLIIDDGSTDSSMRLARYLTKEDSRCRVHELGHNSGGPSAPRNCGLDQAREEMIAFLDADDWWDPNKTVVQVAAMEKNGLALSGTGVRFVARPGRIVETLSPPRRITLAAMKRRNSLVLSSVMVDRSLTGDFSFPYCGHEDYALWLELLRRGANAGGVSECLVNYGVEPGSLSSSPTRNFRFLRQAYRSGLQVGRVESTAYAALYAGRSAARFLRRRSRAITNS